MLTAGLRPRGRRLLVPLAGLLVLVCAVAVLVQPQSPTAAARLAGFCNHLRTPAGRGATDPVTTGRPAVVVLGDSWSSGFLLQDARQAWPTWLGRSEHWQVHVDAVAGTGMVAGALCDQPYLGRVPQVLSHAPARVVVQVGLNDTGVAAATERRTADAVLAALRRVPQVDVVGPPAVPGKVRSQLVAVDATLATACRDEHVRYVSTLGWRLSYLADGVHLTPDGHRQFAARVAAALR